MTGLEKALDQTAEWDDLLHYGDAHPDSPDTSLMTIFPPKSGRKESVMTTADLIDALASATPAEMAEIRRLLDRGIPAAAFVSEYKGAKDRPASRMERRGSQAAPG